MRALKVLTILLVFFATAAFDFTKHSIPVGEIRGGGPPKDGIPALTAPKFVAAGEAGFLKARDKVLGVYVNGVAKAYPVKILNWHEAVNDHIGDLPILATW